MTARMVRLRDWLRDTFLRPRSTLLLHLPAPTREELSALASVIDDRNDPHLRPIYPPSLERPG